MAFNLTSIKVMYSKLFSSNSARVIFMKNKQLYVNGRERRQQ